MQATAPNFVGLGNWFNSAPLNIGDLRGKVVLVNFWTYGCVNCVNALPHVTDLYAKYRDRGLVVVGIHTPEFPFERSAANVQAALKRHGITYPVAQDNDSKTWNAYRNQYWPSQYIVDQQRQNRAPARRRRPVRRDRPHHREAAERQQLRALNDPSPRFVMLAVEGKERAGERHGGFRFNYQTARSIVTTSLRAYAKQSIAR